jgi:hypothetical protein
MSLKPLTADHWPRLSSDLAGPKHPDSCRSCGSGDDLTRWQEHDMMDRVEHIYIVLCQACANTLVEKHPRLYRQVDRNAPSPGVMTLCVDCPARDGTECTSPMATFNGGEGMVIKIPKPSRVHFCRRGKGAQSGWETIYVGPPKSCEGKDAAINQ